MTDVGEVIPVAAAGGRHPLDPEPAPSTKAAAVLALGVIAVILGPLVAGVVPATIALLLAQDARTDLAASRGYLTGADRVRTGSRLAWVGIALAATAVMVAIVVGIVTLVGGVGHDFPATSD